MKRSIVSFSLLALFVAWQADAILHFALTAHAIDEHGHAVHSHQKSDHSSDDHQHPCDQNHNRDSDNTECRVLDLLISAKTKVSIFPPLLTEIDKVESEEVPLYIETNALHGSNLFVISPSNSPPSLV